MEHLYDIEKKKNISGEFAEVYKDNPIKPMPFSALLYNLTQLFHCLPSQLLDEDNNLIMDILTIHNVYGELDQWRSDWDKKKLGAQLGIALELEKLKAK